MLLGNVVARRSSPGQNVFALYSIPFASTKEYSATKSSWPSTLTIHLHVLKVPAVCSKQSTVSRIYNDSWRILSWILSPSRIEDSSILEGHKLTSWPLRHSILILCQSLAINKPVHCRTTRSIPKLLLDLLPLGYYLL